MVSESGYIQTRLSMAKNTANSKNLASFEIKTGEIETIPTMIQMEVIIPPSNPRCRSSTVEITENELNQLNWGSMGNEKLGTISAIRRGPWMQHSNKNGNLRTPW